MWQTVHWDIWKLPGLWIAILHSEGRDLGIVVFIKTCKIATCFVLFHYQTRDGVVVLWYYMSNKHYYAASTSVLYYYICNIKRFRFSNQIKNVCGEIRQKSKPCVKMSAQGTRITPFQDV